MRVLYLAGADHRVEGHIAHNIYKGLSEFCNEIDFVEPNPLPDWYIQRCHLVVSLGIRGKAQAILDTATRMGKPCIVVDLGYIDRAFNSNQLSYYFQVGLGKIGWLPNFLCNKNRLYERVKQLGGKERPTNPNGTKKPILLATQKPGDWQHKMGIAEMQEWANSVVKEIRKYTDRPIVHKPHPKFKGVLNIEGTEDRPFDTQYWLHHCHCLVTYNSTVAVEAAVCGVPFYCDSSAHAYPVSMQSRWQDVEQAQAAPLKDRREYLGRVCYAQWNGEEIASGKPFLDLLDIFYGRYPQTWLLAANSKYSTIPLGLLEEAMSLRNWTKRRQAVKKILEKAAIRDWVVTDQNSLEWLRQKVAFQSNGIIPTMVDNLGQPIPHQLQKSGAA